MRLLIANDFHCGSLLGLTPPRFHNDEYRAFQAPLWDFWESFGETKYDALILNGDLIDGRGRKESVGLLTADLNVQASMAEEAARAIRARQIYVVRGTGYHTDADGGTPLEDMVANALNRDARDELHLEVHDELLHVRHVVGRSDTPYGQGTQVQKEVVNNLLQAAFEEEEAATLLFRAHVHYCFWTGTIRNGRTIQAYTAPALQLRGPRQTGYVRQLRTWLYHVGAIEVEIEPGQVPVVRPHIFKKKIYWERETECLTTE